MDASGERDVFYHYEKRLKGGQWWFENKALSGLNNDHGKPSVQLTEDVDISTMAANQHLDAPQPSLDFFDMYLQWTGLFSDASTDERFVDWLGQTIPSFDHQHLT
jgi:hypothetical protein